MAPVSPAPFENDGCCLTPTCKNCGKQRHPYRYCNGDWMGLGWAWTVRPPGTCGKRPLVNESVSIGLRE